MADDDADTEAAQIDMLQAIRGQSLELGAAADAAQAKLAEAAAAPAPAAAAAAAASAGAAGSAASAATAATAAAVAAALRAPAASARARKEERLTVAMGGGSAAAAEELDKAHKFWSTQPVPRMAADASAAAHGPLEPLRSVEDVRKTPLPLPKGFEWCSIDVTDEAQLAEMYTVRRRAWGGKHPSAPAPRLTAAFFYASLLS